MFLFYEYVMSYSNGFLMADSIFRLMNPIMPRKVQPDTMKYQLTMNFPELISHVTRHLFLRK